MLKWLILNTLIVIGAEAATSDRLHLTGHIRSQSSVRIREIKSSVYSHKYFVEHRSNSINLDQHKIEIEGLNQQGVEGKITELNKNGGMIERRFLLDIITHNNQVSSPVILKITAN